MIEVLIGICAAAGFGLIASILWLGLKEYGFGKKQ